MCQWQEQDSMRGFLSRTGNKETGYKALHEDNDCVYCEILSHTQNRKRRTFAVNNYVSIDTIR